MTIIRWPSGRVFAARWTDLDGNMWLFGGNGTGSTRSETASKKNIFIENVIEINMVTRLVKRFVEI